MWWKLNLNFFLEKHHLLDHKKDFLQKPDIDAILDPLTAFMFYLKTFSLYFVDSFYFRKLKF
jgi:hypothetical protein